MVDLTFVVNRDEISGDIKVNQGTFVTENQIPDADSHDSGLDAASIDLHLPAGTDVYSFGSGRIVGAYAGYTDAEFPDLPITGPVTFGNYVTVEHYLDGMSDPVYVTYAHLSQETADYWVNKLEAKGGPVLISADTRIGEVADAIETPFPVHLHLSFATSYGNYSFPNGIAEAFGSAENLNLLSELTLGGTRLSEIQRGDSIPSAGIENIAISEDGPNQSDTEALVDTTGTTTGVVSLEAPTFMADGDVEFTISLAGVGRGLQYNIAYIIDVSGSMGGQRIADAKSAYIELTNQLIAVGIADVATFAVIPFNSGSTLYADLTAQEAIDRIASLSAGGGTSFGPALANAETFFSSANIGQTNIAYFLSDGQGSGASDSLTNIANVQSFGIGSGANLGSLNIIDSDNAVALSSSVQLADVLTGSSVDVTDIDRIEITLDGQVVETITPDQLVNGPLGLQYTGTLSGLDVSASAQNLVHATVYLTNGAVSGEAELSIASALNGTTIVSDGSSEKVTFGALTTTFDADTSGASNINLLGNNLDNSITATNVGGTFSTFGGNDFFSLGDYANSTVDRVIDGGAGYDIIEYAGNYIQSLVNKVGNVIKIGSNTDTISSVEEIRFDNAVLYTATFSVTFLNSPPVAVADAFDADEDQILIGNVLDDNGNGTDSDPDGDALTVSLISGPTEGILSINGDGSFDYDPNGAFEHLNVGETATDGFTYSVDDGQGGISAAAVSITIEGVNDVPLLFTNNGVKVNEGATGTAIAASTLAATDVDNPAADLVYTITDLPDHGTLLLNDGAVGLGGTLTQSDIDAGLLTYDHDGSEVAADSFEFDLSDGIAVVADQTFDITVNLSLHGTNRRDILAGGAGDDEVFGGRGDDHLDGQGGHDLLDGGKGRDTLLGMSGNDILAGGDGRDHLEGGDGDDILVGGDDRDTLLGMAGNDIVIGGGGSDLIDGGAGNDILTGDGDGDALVPEGAQGHGKLSGANNGYHNWLLGFPIVDLFDGLADLDIFGGGEGDGRDTFIFAPGDGQDEITDFDTRSDSWFLQFLTGDRIDVSAYGFEDDDDVYALAVQDGDDTVIQLSEEDSIRLVGVEVGELDKHDFIT